MLLVGSLQKLGRNSNTPTSFSATDVWETTVAEFRNYDRSLTRSRQFVWLLSEVRVISLEFLQSFLKRHWFRAGRPEVVSRNVFCFLRLVYYQNVYSNRNVYTRHAVKYNLKILSWSFDTSCIWLNMPFFVHAEIYPQTPSQFCHQGYFRTWHDCLACKFNKLTNKQKKGVKTLQKGFSPALAETFSTKIFDIAFWWVFLSIVCNEGNYSGETAWSH